MKPGQLGSSLLPDSTVRAFLSEKLHILQVSRRKTLHIRECNSEVCRQLLNDLGTPTLLTLSFQNLPPNVTKFHLVARKEGIRVAI
jgi:hypothetical protein